MKTKRLLTQYFLASIVCQQNQPQNLKPKGKEKNCLVWFRLVNETKKNYSLVGSNSGGKCFIRD